MDQDTGMGGQKYVQGTASHLVWLQCKVNLQWIAGVFAARSREALKKVLRTLDFGYVGNSGHHLFVSRGMSYSD